MIGQMIDSGWMVWSVCNYCFLVMPADLEWFACKLATEGPCGIVTLTAAVLAALA